MSRIDLLLSARTKRPQPVICIDKTRGSNGLKENAASHRAARLTTFLLRIQIVSILGYNTHLYVLYKYTTRYREPHCRRTCAHRAPVRSSHRSTDTANTSGKYTSSIGVENEIRNGEKRHSFTAHTELG